MVALRGARSRRGARAALLVAGLVLGLKLGAAQAQDAVRGAQLYLQLPAGLPSCVSCHGPDPSANRNNLLNAADRPVDPILLLMSAVALAAIGWRRRVGVQRSSHQSFTPPSRHIHVGFVA